MNKAARTKETVLTAAVKVAEKEGFNRVTRDQIAAHAKVSPATVSKHLSTMKSVRRHIMRRAVRDMNAIVVGQGLAAGNICAQRAPEELKKKAFALMGG